MITTNDVCSWIITLSALTMVCCQKHSVGSSPGSIPASSDIAAQFPLDPGTCWMYEGPTKRAEGDSGEGTYREVEKISRMKWEVVKTDTRGHVVVATVRQTDDPADDFFIIRIGPGKFYDVGDPEQMEKVRAWLAENQCSSEGMIWDDQIELDLPLCPGKIFGRIEDTLRPDRGYCWDVTGAEETDLSGVAGIPPPSRRILYRVEERLMGSRTINEFVPGIGFTRRYFRHNGTPMDHDFRLIEFRRGGKQPKPQKGT